MISRLFADQISFLAEGRNMPVLAKTSLNIMPGEFVVILGHNGSGKSTLIKILSGEKAPTTGMVFVDQKAIAKIETSKRACNIITLTQKPEERLFPNLTLFENIALWEDRFPKNEQLLSEQIIQITERSSRYSKLLNDKVSVLSGGEKQAFLLALTLAHPPSILFLDEHTSSLDPSASDEIMQLTAKSVEDHKITTVMVTHQLADALDYGNRIIILKEGVMVQDIKKPSNITIAQLKQMME